MENRFKTIRIPLTAALMRGELDTAADLLQTMIQDLQGRTHLAEADQKAVTQVLTAVRKLADSQTATGEPRLRTLRKQLKTALAQIVRAEVLDVEYIGYETWRHRVSLANGRYRVMLQNVASCQLSVGCSNFCRRCNEWALAGVRRHFAFEAAQRIIKDLHASGNDRYALYCASDPLDYRCGDRTIADLLRYMQQAGYRTRYGLLTKVPRGSEALAGQFLSEGVDIAVSLTEKNKRRVARIEAAVGKTFNAHHDTTDLLIPAGLDEDFTTVKSSITDNYGIDITPEAAWMVIPTFTSALHPTGQSRIPISATADWFLKKKVGREALAVTYFKPLAVCGPDGHEFVLDRLLDPQIENILLDNGAPELTPPGMQSLAEFCKTFDAAVVRHRQRMAPAVIENLRRRIFAQGDAARRDQATLEKAFARRRAAYLDFCDLEKVADLKRKAFVFLLNAAAAYLKTHPARGDIVRFLRREEAAAWGQSRPAAVEKVMTDPKLKTFDSFSCLLHKLLADPADGDMATFLKSVPAVYDPELDQFV
jgi:hypothetical protein